METDGAMVVLERETWMSRVERHRARAQVWTVPTLDRRARQIVHPVEDFLFNYYPFKLGKLEQWHPGMGVALRCEEGAEPTWMSKHYVRSQGCLYADPKTMEDKEIARLYWIQALLTNTVAQTGNFGCFGMHEWAMVYRTDEIRHGKVTGLRLPAAEVARFVESRPIRCSHYDAFRFFTPAARPLNSLQPVMHERHINEQPACIHANMDLYKWCFKSLPWVSGELLLDCFALAMELRHLDMRASPYDLCEYGYEAVKIETAEGRKQYEMEQRQLAERAMPLRQRLIDSLGRTLAATGKASAVGFSVD